MYTCRLHAMIAWFSTNINSHQELSTNEAEQMFDVLRVIIQKKTIQAAYPLGKLTCCRSNLSSLIRQLFLRKNEGLESDMFSFDAEQYSTHEVILWIVSGQFWMSFVEVYGSYKVMVQPSQCMAKKGTRDILLSGLNWCYWSIMRGCIYGKKISLVHASFTETASTDLWAENRYLGDTRYLPCTKERKIYTVSIFSPSNRAQNSDWGQSLHGWPRPIWDTSFVTGLRKDHQIGRWKWHHNSPIEEASFESDHSFRISIWNSTKPRSQIAPTLEYFFPIFPYPTPRIRVGRKNFSRFPEEKNTEFNQDGRLILAG